MSYPQGVIRIIESGGTEIASSAVADLAEMYAVLGPADARLKWREIFGFDSLGADGVGNYVFPDFPILSKVA